MAKNIQLSEEAGDNKFEGKMNEMNEWREGGMNVVWLILFILEVMWILLASGRVK